MSLVRRSELTLSHPLRMRCESHRKIHERQVQDAAYLQHRPDVEPPFPRFVLAHELLVHSEAVRQLRLLEPGLDTGLPEQRGRGRVVVGPAHDHRGVVWCVLSRTPKWGTPYDGRRGV